MALALVFCLVASACGARVQYFAASSGDQSVLPGSSGSNSNPSGSVGNASTSQSNTTVAGGNTSSVSVSGATGSVPGNGNTSQNPGGTQSNNPGSGNTGTGNNNGQQSVNGVTTSSLTPTNFSYNPEQQAALCTGTTGNTSSAPGVSSSTITLGNVSGITGLIPSSFTSGSQAVEAAFDAVNRFGGICGRQLKLDVEDDQQNASNNQADVEDLIPKTLAFVGSLSDADNGGVNAMVAANEPDLGAAINTNRSNASNYWSASGGSLIARNGGYYINNAWLLGLKANHDLPKSIAILSYSIDISQQAGQQFASAFQQSGVNICYTDYNIEAGAQSTSIPTDVREMQAKGCGGVYTTMDVVGNANMLDAMQNDDYHPQLISTTYEGYSPDQISTAGEQASQGLQVALNSVPLNEPNPGVEQYQQELSTYEPGQTASEFGLESWADAQMFIYALLKGGRNPTRASLTTALSQITNWTTDGAIGPVNPATHSGTSCASDVIVQGNNFVTDWPSSGLSCGGQLIKVGSY